MTSNSTTDLKDLKRFEELAQDWWDPNGPLKSLHQFTPIRVEYIKSAIRRHQKGSWGGANPLANLKILDIGCGGGLIAEPMARLGGIVSAIDASSSAIKTAKLHAEISMLDITYASTTAEELALKNNQFDVIYASEVIEHVSDRKLFLYSIRQLIKPDGVVIFTTINRTLASLVMAKFAAEYVLKIVPKGAHDFNKFVKPYELQNEALKAGIVIDDITGFKLLPNGRFKFSSFTAVNYGASGSLVRI